MSDGLRQIVLATDLSEECLRALEWSLQQVSGDRVKGDKYHIVHVAKLKVISSLQRVLSVPFGATAAEKWR